MKLKDARDNYYFYTGKASELVRQLGLAGIAVIWLFKKEVAGVPKIPEELLLPLVLIVLGLALDLLQYVSASIIWGVFQRWKEKRVEEDERRWSAYRRPPSRRRSGSRARRRSAARA